MRMTDKASLTVWSRPLAKRTQLDYRDMIYIKIALLHYVLALKKVNMKDKARKVSGTVRKVSAITAKQKIKK